MPAAARGVQRREGDLRSAPRPTPRATTTSRQPDPVRTSRLRGARRPGALAAHGAHGTSRGRGNREERRRGSRPARHSSPEGS
jgi:hypothetical protein